MKKWFRRWSWMISRWWYQVKLWFGWWHCENCEKMHSPFTAKYEFNTEQEYECCKGVYALPVPKSHEGDPDYYYSLVKDLYRVE